MKRRIQPWSSRRGGFTLTEVLISSSLSVLIMSVTLSVFITCMKSWKVVDGDMLVDRELNAALSCMVYGIGGRSSLRSATSVTNSVSPDGWTLRYATLGSTPQTNFLTYSSSAGTLVFSPGGFVVARDLSYAPPPVVGGHSLVVTMRVSRVEANMPVQRMATTLISWRN